MTRKIIHLDLDAFFCAVEELENPALRGKPFAVGGSPDSRGVVASCSYPARRYGIHSAMPMAQAQRLCPQLIVTPARHREYRTVSRQVMARLLRLTEWVEQLSIDEAFLDVSARPEPAETLARQLQATIREELGLPSSLGVATNKLVAKIANNVGKASAKGAGPPNAVQVVAPGMEAAFLAPLPCRDLWGVGPKTAERLEALGLHTLGALAVQSAEEMARHFGKLGYELVQRAQGIDTRPVVTARTPKSVSNETTFARDVSDEQALLQTLHHLAQGVSRDLRRKRLKGTTVKLKLRWADFTTPTRQLTLAQPTDDGDEIAAAARMLFRRLWLPGKSVRLLGVGVSGLGKQPRQIGLFDPPDVRSERLEEAVRAVRTRFGEDLLVRGSDMLTQEDDAAPDAD